MSPRDFVTDIAFAAYTEAVIHLAYCGNGNEEARFGAGVQARMTAGEDELAAIAGALHAVVAAPRSMYPAQMDMVHRFRALALQVEQALAVDMAEDYECETALAVAA